MIGTPTPVTTKTTSYQEEDIDLETDLETAAVMKQRVEKSTREGYEQCNLLFTIWLFDNHRKYPKTLEPNLYHELKTHDVMDKVRMTRNGKKSKSRESIRKACQNALRGIKPGVDQLILLKLDLLDFKVFSRFLSTFKKRV